MDCSPPPVAWELLPPPGEEMEGGAGVAGGGGSRFRRAEPSREPAMCHQGLDIYFAYFNVRSLSRARQTLTGVRVDVQLPLFGIRSSVGKPLPQTKLLLLIALCLFS